MRKKHFIEQCIARIIHLRAKLKGVDVRSEEHLRDWLELCTLYSIVLNEEKEKTTNQFRL